MWSADYVCCIISNAPHDTFTIEANTMNPDQTAPKSNTQTIQVIDVNGEKGDIFFRTLTTYFQIPMYFRMEDESQTDWQNSSESGENF